MEKGITEAIEAEGGTTGNDGEYRRTLSEITEFKKKYSADPRNMVADGLVKAAAKQTFKGENTRVVFSRGHVGTELSSVARHLETFLLNQCAGELKLGAPPKSAPERYLGGWLNKRRDKPT